MSWFGEFSLVVVVAAGAWVACLTDRDDVQGGVELAVAGPGEPVTALVAAGGVDRGGAAVAGVVMPTGESGYVTTMGEDLRG